MIFKKNFSLFSILLIIALSFAIYSNSFFAEFQFDDGVHIVKQDNIKEIDHFSKLSSWTNINERPLSFFTLSLNYSIHELDVYGYHLFNLIIHVLTGIIIYLLALLIIKSQHWKGSLLSGNEKIVSLFVALIFVAHPIQTQAVTYVVQRMTSLASLFYLGSIYFYLQGRFEYVKDPNKRKVILFYALSFSSAVAALLSKQIAATLPLAILLVEFFFVKNAETEIYKKYIRIFSGFLMFLFTLILVFGLLPKETESIRRGEYLLTQFRVLAKYVQLLIFPVSQNLDYDFSISKTLWGFKEILSLLFNVALIYISVRLIKKHRIIAFGIFWIYITLLLESSIIPISDVIFEHRLYLPMFGFALIVGLLIFSYIGLKKIKIAIIFSTIIVLVLGYLAFERNKVWKTNISLWSDVVEKSPNKARPHLNLGIAYFQSSKQQLALKEFDKTIKIDSTNWQAYYNRAAAFTYLNKPQFALQDLDISIRIKNDYADSYDARGLVKLQLQDIKGAIKDFNKAIEFNPLLESVWFNRANAKIFMKNYEGAMLDYDRALKINNRFAEAYNNRGKLKLNLRFYDEAVQDLNQAILIKPNFDGAYNNRAKANMATNNLDAAIADLSQSILIYAKNPMAYRYRAICYYRQLDYKRAYNDFLKAAQLGDEISSKFVKEIELKLKNDKN